MQNRHDMRMSDTTPTFATLRRKAARRGYMLTRIREESRWYNTYGTFMISDAIRNVVLHYGLSAEGVNEWLNRD